MKRKIGMKCIFKFACDFVPCYSIHIIIFFVHNFLSQCALFHLISSPFCALSLLPPTTPIGKSVLPSPSSPSLQSHILVLHSMKRPIKKNTLKYKFGFHFKFAQYCILSPVPQYPIQVDLNQFYQIRTLPKQT